MRPVAARRFLFDAYLLGGKAPTFDYIVYLVGLNGDRTGPFFFLQVRTTTKTPKQGVAYGIDFSATDVKRAQATKIPFFVCVVDRSVTRCEKFFIMGVDSKRTAGITRLAPVHDLATDAVKIDLYNELTRLWDAQTTPALAKFI